MSRWAAAWCRALGIVAAFAGLGACGAPELRGRLGAVDALIATARESGALRCAPVELAMAESHADFARQELAEGRYYPARRELGRAESNAHDAVRRSPRDLCSAAEREPSEPSEPSEPASPPDRDGDGVLDDQDACPDEPEDLDGFQDEDGCPEPDNDGDGILDEEDACPLEAEDKDGFQDEDGCPDLDNDGDGVPDADDLCPDKAASTPDGCPVYKHVQVTESKIQIKQTIYFELKKATIRRVSYGLLDDVAQVLRDNPRIRVRIEGHTDDRGRDAFNLRLSQDRASAVRDFLVGRGIDAARLEAQGYGKETPVADNRTEAGRAQNRRVEFIIIER